MSGLISCSNLIINKSSQVCGLQTCELFVFTCTFVQVNNAFICTFVQVNNVILAEKSYLCMAK